MTTMSKTTFAELLEEYSPFPCEPSCVDLDFYILPGGRPQYRLEDNVRGLTIACGFTVEEVLEKAGIDIESDLDAKAVIAVARMPHTWGMKFGVARNKLAFASVGILTYFGSTMPCRPHTEYGETFSEAIRRLRWNVDLAETDIRRWLEDMRRSGNAVRLRYIPGEHPYYRVELTTKYGHYRSHGSDPYSALVPFGIYATDSASAFFVEEDDNDNA